MPPAFNLSQDQTLQFNLCLNSRLTSCRTRSPQLHNLFYIVRVTSSLHSPNFRDSGNQEPTPINRLVFKELANQSSLVCFRRVSSERGALYSTHKLRQLKLQPTSNNNIKRPDQRDQGVFKWEPGGDLLSHTEVHYHRRGFVSRSCSRWEGVGPKCYGRQA